MILNSLGLLIPGILLALFGLLSAVRVLLIYGHPLEVRRRFLIYTGLGLSTSAILWGSAVPDWAVIVTLGGSLAPISLWLTWRWLNYEGPPPGFIKDPPLLDELERGVEDAAEPYDRSSRARR